jgi:hypothetical protein
MGFSDVRCGDPHGFVPFIRVQRMLVIAGADDGGAIWSTIVDGPTGFAEVVDARTVVIDALPASGDPLREAFRTERDIGVLALQSRTRRRIRMNGVARRDRNRLVMRTDQVLGNCPKYLQTGTVKGDRAGRRRTGRDRRLAQRRPAAVDRGRRHVLRRQSLARARCRLLASRRHAGVRHGRQPAQDRLAGLHRQSVLYDARQHAVSIRLPVCSSWTGKTVTRRS